MIMVTEDNKYQSVINILKKSLPVPVSAEEIEREVIKRISKIPDRGNKLTDVMDFLFGWVYIGWVRRSLITASVILVIVFVYQQGIILKQINYLSRQTVVVDGATSLNPESSIEKRLMMYKMTGRRFASKNITISEKQMEELIDSVNALQIRYKDLINLINENPEIKNFVEKKLIENSRKKIKL
jgi:hypothetical protein